MTEPKQGETTLYAVITGDIVRSRRLSAAARQAVPQLLRTAAQNWADVHPGSLHGGIHVFRGDSWQAVIQHPQLAMRFAVLMRAQIKAQKLDTRVSVGVDTVDFIPNGSIPEGDGQAFVLSGRGLDALRNGVHMCFAMPCLEKEGAMRLLCQLTDSLIESWTPRQALVMTRALTGFTIARIAEDLSLSQPSVSKYLWLANHIDIHDVLVYFEQEVGHAVGINSGDTN